MISNCTICGISRIQWIQLKWTLLHGQHFLGTVMNCKIREQIELFIVSPHIHANMLRLRVIRGKTIYLYTSVWYVSFAWALWGYEWSALAQLLFLCTFMGYIAMNLHIDMKIKGRRGLNVIGNRRKNNDWRSLLAFERLLPSRIAKGSSNKLSVIFVDNSFPFLLALTAN